MEPENPSDQDTNTPTSKRESYYNHQRSSLPSSHSKSRPVSGESDPIPALANLGNLENLADIADPPPILQRRRESPQHKTEHLVEDDKKQKRRSGGSTSSHKSARHIPSKGRQVVVPHAGPSIIASYASPEEYDNLNELVGPLRGTPEETSLYNDNLEPPRARSSFSSGRAKRGQRPATGRGSVFSGLPEENLTALPRPLGGQPRKTTLRNQMASSRSWRSNLGKPASPPEKPASKFATQLYTVSYLVFFSILGTLARLGLQWLTFYPGAPVVTGVLWANFAGSFIMGFLIEDRRLFREEWGPPSSYDTILREQPRSAQEGVEKESFARTEHSRIKKTIPLYIGLATGFCGSFTSFSAFMRDSFFALSNNLASPISHPYPTGVVPPATNSTISRNGGYSFMAVCAVIILTLALCLSALKSGAHVAIFLDPYIPSLPFAFVRKGLDRSVVVLGFGCWLGAVFLAIWPPDRPGGPESRGTWDRERWRGDAVFACVFAPLGCLLRFYASLKLNGISPSFPLGTFAVNIFGTAVLGMAYDLQHVNLGSGTIPLIGGGRAACQVLQGIMDGFDGCLTTVSTFVAELSILRRSHAYTYGSVSVLFGLGILVVVMGSVRWTVGWTPASCT